MLTFSKYMKIEASKRKYLHFEVNIFNITPLYANEINHIDQLSHFDIFFVVTWLTWNKINK